MGTRRCSQFQTSSGKRRKTIDKGGKAVYKFTGFEINPTTRRDDQAQ
jgi:hypothetical protein